MQGRTLFKPHRVNHKGAKYRGDVLTKCPNFERRRGQLEIVIITRSPRVSAAVKERRAF